MRILLIGNGGRENAIAWKITSSESFRANDSVLYCTEANPGMQNVISVNIKSVDIESIIDFVSKENIEFVVVGPEIPLSLGIVDRLEEKGIKVFGPSKNAARIETSKSFAKDLMSKAGVPTAGFKAFNSSDISSAKDYIKGLTYPVVIKASGLAAGKGVIIAENENEAFSTVDELSQSFGEAGNEFIIEEFLQGEEVSIFAVTDGENYVILPSSQDHKRIGEKDTGKNTGGMGAIAPLSYIADEEVLANVKSKIIEQVLKALRDNGSAFKGCLYCGLMVNKNKETYVIEFNCRFGDPETQAVLPLIDSDFLELLKLSAEGNLSEYNLKVKDAYSACVVLASGGYPDRYSSGYNIDDNGKDDCLIFHAGTNIKDDKLSTAGGRVLCVVGISENSLQDAINKCYERIDKISFTDMYYRKDIGQRYLNFSEKNV